MTWEILSKPNSICGALVLNTYSVQVSTQYSNDLWKYSRKNNILPCPLFYGFAHIYMHRKIGFGKRSGDSTDWVGIQSVELKPIANPQKNLKKKKKNTNNI